MGAKARAEVDPVVAFPFEITKTDKIVTAGSCFAQHIARFLTMSGFSHYISEPAHPILGQNKQHNYGLFSARYGNIYTSRQLRQLFERALGRFKPAEGAWEEDVRFLDPFRPTIQPGGFRSLAELEADRTKHLACVLKSMTELDVFVFTLGLTETWVCTEDGAALPVCPGTQGGTFDPEKYQFVNLTVEEVVEDMRAAIGLLREVNPKARVIITVSPVPLAATAREKQHVLVSTTYPKAVLRVAAETLTNTVPDVAYFPSFEVITGNHARGAYFARDLRNVTDDGVEHVMGLFFKHAAGVEISFVDKAEAPEAPPTEDDAAERVTEVLCEEALLDVE